MSLESSSASSWWNFFSVGTTHAEAATSSTSNLVRRSSSNQNSHASAPSNGGAANTSESTSRDSDEFMSAVAGLVLELGFLVATSYVASLLINKLLKNWQPEGEENTASLTAAEKRLEALQQARKSTTPLPPLTNYERQIAQDVVDPNDIPTHFQDIGGIDEIKQELWELAVLPLQRPDLFSSSHLLQQPGGILLYGPPGTGKTMLAKAIAKEANATFIAVKLSKIMNKWFGESNKLIDAIFSLARKLAPSVIFVDELDTFLNPRDGAENSAGNAIKAEFLTLWDGITTRQDQEPVVVLGATNRPNQVDSAILRRLPRMFRISLPNPAGRLQILKLTLKDHPMEAKTKDFLPKLAKQYTKGYSGSDLKELCHCAAMQSIRDVVRETARKAVTEKSAPKTSDAATVPPPQEPKSKLRPLTVQDFEIALTKVKRTGQDAAEYERQEFQKTHPTSDSPNHDALQSLAALSKLMSDIQPPPTSSSREDEESEEEEDLDDIPQL